MISHLKQMLPHGLRQRLKRSLFAHQDMRTRLMNLRRAGFQTAAAIDVGAYRGDWTREFWSVWPDSPSIMIEALPSKFQVLSAQAHRVPRSVVVPSAVGRQPGQVHFRVQETNSGITLNSTGPDVITVRCTTLDAVLDERPDLKPNLLKLDVQGCELDVLAGCANHLKEMEVIILEVSLLRIGDVPIFSEVDRFMGDRGYRLYDVLPQYYRPLDGALWQLDAFYVREDSRLIASRSWD